jgi:hypothetical protein
MRDETRRVRAVALTRERVETAGSGGAVKLSPSMGDREPSAELSVVARGATNFVLWRRPSVRTEWTPES